MAQNINIVTCSIASGSSGNSIYLGADCGHMLFDAGVSARALTRGLVRLGCNPDKLDAVFITHDHIDHVRGLPVFLKGRDIPVFMSRGTMERIKRCRFDTGLINACCIAPGEAVEIGGISVTPFPTPHDTPGSFGYVASVYGCKAVGVATDIGHVSAPVRGALAGCHTVYIESNYDPEMLARGGYPIDVKRRIISENGHLSNDDCARFLPELVCGGTRNITLFHLSRDNNTHESALSRALEGLLSAGLRSGEFRLAAASPSDVSAMRELTADPLRGIRDYIQEDAVYYGNTGVIGAGG